MAQSVPKRMAIISAGVIMNVIFAFVMASIAYGLGVKEVPCIVRGVVPGGAAWQANLQPGDVIQRIGKIENPRFRDLITGVTLGDIENGIEFQIKRPTAGKTFIETLHPDTSLGVPMIGIVGPLEHHADRRFGHQADAEKLVGAAGGTGIRAWRPNPKNQRPAG